MKDSIVAVISTVSAGVAQITQNPEILTQDDPMQTAVGAVITLVVGVISTLLSRFLNKLAKKKSEVKRSKWQVLNEPNLHIVK